MIDLLSTTQVLLKDAGYSVRLSEIQREPLVCFEDNAFVGFCKLFEKPDDMLNMWRAYETEILTRFAPSFRAAGDKAWNVYSVFLSSAPATRPEAREVSWIEEDLNRTRKIASCGVTSREELARILLPVLPLQHQPRLPDSNITRRLEARIGDIAPQARAVALDPNVPPEEVVRLLGERL